MKKKRVKLYNVIFPIWMLWLFPQTWLVALPANFLIDFLVIVFSMRYLQIPDRKSKVKKVILKTWLCGFAADFVGTFLMILIVFLDFDRNTAFGRWWYDCVSDPVCLNPFGSIWAFLWVTFCVAVTAFCIYNLNKKICLSGIDLEEGQKKKLAWSMAVLTAPYLFYLPTEWLW